jgi:hypothetical protein
MQLVLGRGLVTITALIVSFVGGVFLWVSCSEGDPSGAAETVCDAVGAPETIGFWLVVGVPPLLTAALPSGDRVWGWARLGVIALQVVTLAVLLAITSGNLG